MSYLLRQYCSEAIIMLLPFIFSFCNHPGQKERNTLNFTTWENPCFDRCASVWLIKNYIDSTATFKYIEFGKKVSEGIPFDVPGAELGRQKNISCFESILLKYNLNDAAITEMAKVIHDIDVNKWGVKVTADADSLELVFNALRKQIESDPELTDRSAEIFWNMYKKYGQ